MKIDIDKRIEEDLDLKQRGKDSTAGELFIEGNYE
jgi:hypothetical protein